MTTLLDQDTVVLDALDFEPTCDCLRRGVQRCGLEASHQLLCVECARVTCFVCTEHAIWTRRSDRTVTHTACGARGRIKDVREVVPL